MTSAFYRPRFPQTEFVGDGFRWDIPGPYVLEWRIKHARDRLNRVQTFVSSHDDEVIPVATGVAFAAAPYVVGAGIIAFAPPWWKPVGLSMMVPTGAGEAFWFGVGYGFGHKIQDSFEDW